MRRAWTWEFAAALALLAAGCETGTIELDAGPGTDSGPGFDAGPMAADCFDGRRDGDETDRDCGGSCPPCMLGRDCAEGTDCRSGACIEGVCAEPTCFDAVQNQDESDIDCGGGCDPCPEEARCNRDGDCSSLSCRGGMCAAPACDDGAMNGRETDVDCGGPACDGCATGQMCDRRDDCVDFVCRDNACAPAACDDNITNGEETDRDCGGPVCRGCRDRQMCVLPSDCGSGVCTAGACVGSGDFMDDFETGTLISDWTSITPAWTVTNMSPIAGTYSAVSASIPDNGSTSLEVTVDCVASAMVSFAYRVSTEGFGDDLEFFVDGVRQSGATWDLNDAGTANYALTTGRHTLRWTYSKDFFGSGGSDQAWIDDVVTMNCSPI